MSDENKTASFGFRDVAPEEKPALVREVFSSVAQRYDLMNDLMSAGVHRLWKDAFVDWLNPQPGMAVLDVAGGTGDIAFRIAERTAKRGASAKVTICDINFEMLSNGVLREQAKNPNIAWVCGDAENLPVADATQDAYTIAFGIRNTTHFEKVLAEAYRVLKPGGRFLCLEFSRVTAPGLDALYDLYSFSVLPKLGEVVAGDGAAYRYLAESIRRWPSQAQFAKAIGKAGFAQVKVRNLSGGIAAMHSGWKL
ncbi:MAG: bifunctional demethylmenaquinone methyltransferase/2-methoxy-6-polyprenyl-1,4-benzoquinol methylase UbiE [Alphaproteobacteria bacterium]|nr:bifunctional demethylmenaquinone methyltransferase/2-methoxy-6-polyprenyl-1,4-benzoquinol methylase UbiE [Alphaproteobacteria bacterium]